MRWLKGLRFRSRGAGCLGETRWACGSRSSVRNKSELLERRETASHETLEINNNEVKENIVS